MLRQQEKKTQPHITRMRRERGNKVRIQSGRSRQIIMGVASISREDIIIWFSRSPNQQKNKWNCKTQSTRCNTHEGKKAKKNAATLDSTDHTIQSNERVGETIAHRLAGVLVLFMHVRSIFVFFL